MSQMSNLIEIRPQGGELYHSGRQADRRMEGLTDMMKLTLVQMFSGPVEV